MKKALEIILAVVFVCGVFLSLYLLLWLGFILGFDM